MTNTGWYFRWANTDPGFSLHKLLYYPVFKRMIADYHQPSLESQQFNGLSQGCFQVLEFVVDSYSKCLEGFCSWMEFASAADNLLYQASQLARCLYRAFSYDTPGDAKALAFFAVCFQQMSQSRLRCGINNICGSNLLIGIKPHIQRCVILKAESTAVPVELKGRDTEIKQDAMYRGEVVFMADSLQINEVVINQKGGISIMLESFPGYFYGIRIGINAK